MVFTEQLARERTRSNLKQAEQLRYSRRLRTLRRAQRLENRAERRMLQQIDNYLRSGLSFTYLQVPLQPVVEPQAEPGGLRRESPREDRRHGERRGGGQEAATRDS